jgi:hypothetical protein
MALFSSVILYSYLGLNILLKNVFLNSVRFFPQCEEPVLDQCEANAGLCQY